MSFCDRPAEGEPESCATGTSRARAVRAGEALEKVITVLDGHAGAVVGDLEVPTGVGGMGPEQHGGALRGVAQRIVDQVVYDAAQQRWVGHHLAGIRCGDVDMAIHLFR